MDVSLANMCRTQSGFVTLHVKVLSVFFFPFFVTGLVNSRSCACSVSSVSLGVFVDCQMFNSSGAYYLSPRRYVRRKKMYRLYVRGVFKKRPNFLNSAPTSIESVLRLLNTPSVRFWQQTAICPVSLWTLVVEIHPLSWARTQAVRRINDNEKS
jgi:hypothetical protein